MELLSIKDFSVIYKTNNKNIHAVNNISFDVFEQDSVGIIGESGSGKSTLALALLRLLPEKTAEIKGTAYFDGVDLLSLSEEELSDIRWTKLAIVFQKSMNALSPVHRIGHQLADIYRVHNKTATSEAIKQRVLELLEMVSLSQRVYNLYQHELSGGMMQRVSIALSLLFNPSLLILDEATTALDVVTQSQILDEIVKLEEKVKITKLMITHDISVVARACEKVMVMYAGYILEMGLTRDVLAKPAHPYTIGLIKSYPAFKGERGELKGISGCLPDLCIQVKGCIFADRCSKCFERCRVEAYPKVKLSDGRIVACYLAGGRQ